MEHITSSSQTPPHALTGFVSDSEIQTRTHGAGFIIEYVGEEYLVAANHVASGCDYQPLIDIGNHESTSPLLWLVPKWDVIGVDEEADVAILQMSPDSRAKLTAHSARYGDKSVLSARPWHWASRLFKAV